MPMIRLRNKFLKWTKKLKKQLNHLRNMMIKKMTLSKIIKEIMNLRKFMKKTREILRKIKLAKSIRRKTLLTNCLTLINQ